MIVKIHARTNNALQGIIDHYKDSRKLQNRLRLRTLGVNQEINADKKILIINFEGLIKKILNKGGTLGGFKEQMKNDFLKDLAETMAKAGAKENDYEVIFNDEQ